MKIAAQPRVNWRALLRARALRYLFAAIFVSLFGSGLNFAGVVWYVLERTGSTVNVSLVVILGMLPGLVVPPFGGVLIDRVDRRYLGIAVDLVRGGIVLGTAALLAFGSGGLWHVYAMTLLLGMGFAVYWPTTSALVHEVVPAGQLVAANAALLIAVQGGMMTAGSVVGFIYEQAGLPGILTLDGATYLASALLLARMRRGYFPPRRDPPEPAATDGAEVWPSEAGVVPAAPASPNLLTRFLTDLKEGLHYLWGQPQVLALGLTMACMMAGVLSGNVLIVALARDVLQAGPRGFGYMEAGWALGAVTGGVVTELLVRRFPPLTLLILGLTTLSVGHAFFPYARVLVLAVAMNALFGGCRALSGVVAQSTIMSIVPRPLMGRTQSAFSLIMTLLQVAMSFSLGWLAQHFGLPLAFVVLGLLYGGAVAAAFRARALARHAPAIATVD